MSVPSGGKYRWENVPDSLEIHTSYRFSLQTQGTRWFLIFAGAILGVTAAMLWSAQGSIMMSYPLEKDKGKAFAIFWAMFQFGSFLGSVIALAINIRSGKLSAVSTSTYLVLAYLVQFLYVNSDMCNSIHRPLLSSFLLVLHQHSCYYHRTKSFVPMVLSSKSRSQAHRERSSAI